MRIVITRDGALVRHVEIGNRDLRIGRNTDNDIVLEDQDKSISRVHAEIRLEGDRVTVLDLNSQNGVWLNGQRVLNATLAPGTPVTIGRYQLALEGSAPTVAVEAAVSNETQRIEAVKNQTAAYVRPVAPRAAQSASAVPAAARASGARLDPLTRLARMPKPKLFAIFGAVAVVAVVITATLRPSPSTEGGEETAVTSDRDAEIAQHLSAAKDLLASGQARAAIEEHLDRVLLVAPDHQEALDLRAAAERVAEQAPTAEPAPSAAAGGGLPPSGAPPSAVGNAPSPEATPPTASGPPPTAAATKPAPPAVADPAPAGGGATAPAAPRTARRPSPEPAVADPPFPRRPGETQTAWRERGVQLQRRYREAMSLLEKADFARAITALQEIADDQPRYLDVETRLAEARTRVRGSAAAALRAGHDREREGDLAGARAQFQRAIEIDPKLEEATTALAALTARLEGSADDFYRHARQYDALGYRAEAVDHYERALATLPDADGRRSAVAERMNELRPLVKKPGTGR